MTKLPKYTRKAFFVIYFFSIFLCKKVNNTSKRDFSLPFATHTLKEAFKKIEWKITTFNPIFMIWNHS